ncbi:hypothetical protein GCM10022206_34270 [Streptomyces chiangmaiensis]
MKSASRAQRSHGPERRSTFARASPVEAAWPSWLLTDDALPVFLGSAPEAQTLETALPVALSQGRQPEDIPQSCAQASRDQRLTQRSMIPECGRHAEEARGPGAEPRPIAGFRFEGGSNSACGAVRPQERAYSGGGQLVGLLLRERVDPPVGPLRDLG